MGKDSERGKYASPDGSRTWEYLCAMFGAIGSFIVGSLLGWNSPSLAELRGPSSRIAMTPGEASTLAASTSVGHMLAPVLGIFLLDRFGRRKCILGAAVPLAISWGMITVAEHVMVLTAARMLGGFAMGILMSTTSIYNAEILSASIRGALSASSMITYSLGVLFMFAAGPYLGFRITAGICFGMSVLFLVCFWFTPESPYFLVMVGREDEAQAALEKLRGRKDVAEEIELIRATIHERGKALIKSSANEKEPRKRSAVKLLFTIQGNVKALLIGLVLTTLQHLCGMASVVSYSHIIFAAIGSEVDAYWASITICLMQILSSVIAVGVLDKIGRRPLFFTSAVITCLLLVVIASYFYLLEHTDVDVSDYTILPLCSMFALILTAMAGLIPVGTMLMSEMFASDVKLLGVCIITVVGSTVGALASKYYLVLALSPAYGHSSPFSFFATMTILCTISLVRWLPETRGKTLLRIQQELNA